MQEEVQCRLSLTSDMEVSCEEGRVAHERIVSCADVTCPVRSLSCEQADVAPEYDIQVALSLKSSCAKSTAAWTQWRLLHRGHGPPRARSEGSR